MSASRRFSYECYFQSSQITEKLESLPETGCMRSIVVHGVNLLIGIALVTANFYSWAVIWDWVVGPCRPHDSRWESESRRPLRVQER